MITFELFALSSLPAARLWAVVGDPWRLPDWTDADEVLSVDPQPVAVGSTVTTVDGGTVRTWRVATVEPGLLEVVTRLPDGRLGLGARVVPDPAGSRLVLACAYRPADRWASVRFRAVGAAALRRRFDRWSGAALRVAAAPAG